MSAMAEPTLADVPGPAAAGPAGRRHHVVEVRATGVTPEAVAARMQDVLDSHDRDGWTLREIQPIIYNSSTTGYLLLIFERPGTGEPGPR